MYDSELVKAATEFFLKHNGKMTAPWAIDSTGLGMPREMALFGAEWALNHQWVDANERLPKEEFDDGYTFVFVRIEVDEDTFLLETDYIRNGKWELHPDKKVTHWMPIPKL